jgi:hypothetical protein
VKSTAYITFLTIVVVLFLSIFLSSCLKTAASTTPTPPGTGNSGATLTVKLLDVLQIACEVGGSLASPAAAPWFLKYCPAAVTGIIALIQANGTGLYAQIQATVTALKEQAGAIPNLAAKDLGYINTALTAAGQIVDLFVPAPATSATAAASRQLVITSAHKAALDSIRARAVALQTKAGA